MPDLDTVDVKEFTEEARALITSLKFSTPFEVCPSSDGYSLFRVRFFGKGETPAALSGRYTSVILATKAVVDYIKQHKGTSTARGEYFAKLREEGKKKSDKHRPKKDDDLFSGSDNGS
jgi:hypothetical protein